ncbi:MAG TPA: hypothetical protein V6C99_03820 [Oculatellaceae cyanobacterium]
MLVLWDWQLLYQDPYYLIFGRKTLLQRMPGYNARRRLTVERLSIPDFITSSDLARFKL